MKRYFALFGVLIVAAAWFAPSARSQVLEIDLAEMISSSGMIFSGTVMEVRGDRDERGDIVTYTTFRVEAPIRGVQPGSVTIKQFGGTSSAGTMMVPHMRYFREGERMLVMLYPASELGFTSPIGMGNGAWIVDDAGMVHGITSGLLGDLSAAATRYGVKPGITGEVPLTNMISLIQAATNGGKF